MKNMTQLRKRKGVSPVIATVILVAVTITIAVAVAYWMSGIAGQYTAFEKVEIQSAVISYVDGPTDDYWTVTIKLKNSGTKTATLTNVFVNDVEAVFPLAAAGMYTADLDSANVLLILGGATDTVIVWIGDNGTNPLSSGTTVNIKIHSAGGMDYIKLIELV